MGIYALIAFIYIVYKLLKEKLEKPKPRIHPVNEYWMDLPKETIVDVARYEYDKKHHGEEFAEYTRSKGNYRYVEDPEMYNLDIIFGRKKSNF
ncbi:MAG: hypothetical protein IKT57_01090 [Clostridia bacterium]|nr:hypothetical protein [Clostridia bacterium]